MAANTLSLRARNRALLARQHLIQRTSMSALAMIEHLVGMQAQATEPPYFGLWSRLEHFAPHDLSELYTQREVVRVALMRSTIHLVSARDCLIMRPLVQPVLERGFKSIYAKHLAGVEISDLIAAGRQLVEEQSRTYQELGVLLGERWPTINPAALAQAIRTWETLVQVPPRGLWGQSGPAAHTNVETWLGQPLYSTPSIDGVVLRYLAAFGPASVRDIQTWSGLTKLSSIVERLRPDLITFRNDQGVELFDLPDAPRPDETLPLPARLVAPFDNLLLSHADRRHVFDDSVRSRFITVNGLVHGTILIDGFVGGLWKILQHRQTATLHIEHFMPLSSHDTHTLTEEGARLLAFATPESEHDLRFSLTE